MLLNARDASESGGLATDLCIIGSGPAGMTLARELAGTGLRVLLLESGGVEEKAEVSRWNSGTVVSPQGYPPHVLVEGRRRQLGGTANLWNHEPRGQREKFLRCVPLDELDFEKRSWVPESGWPFSRDELMPFYERAQRVLGLGRFDYASDPWRKEGDAVLETAALRSTVSQFGLPERFLKGMRAELEQSENVTLLLEANLLRLEPDAKTRRIASAEVAAAGRGRFLVQAGTFVLAAGGLENPRILLLNDGLGNENDVVGRYFMDHPSITLGTLIPPSTAFFERAAFYDQQIVDGHPVMGKLQLRPEVIRREELLNLYAVLVPHFRNLHSNLPFILRELLAKGPPFLARHLPRRRAGGAAPVTHAEAAFSLHQRLLEGYFSECYCGWSQLSGKRRRFGEFGVRALVELSPDRENRVALGEEVDDWGQRKIRLSWRWNERDLRSIRRTQEIFRSELEAAGLGTFVPVAEMSAEHPRAFYSTHHFMGTTRMHADPAQGVVDGDGRVHGWGNLLVTGSSVFPTGGCANPTLTVIALAIRLADHLKTQAAQAK